MIYSTYVNNKKPIVKMKNNINTVFWCLVFIINIVLILDIIFNSGKIFVDILYMLYKL